MSRRRRAGKRIARTKLYYRISTLSREIIDGRFISRRHLFSADAIECSRHALLDIFSAGGQNA